MFTLDMRKKKRKRQRSVKRKGGMAEETDYRKER